MPQAPAPWPWTSRRSIEVPELIHPIVSGTPTPTQLPSQLLPDWMSIMQRAVDTGSKIAALPRQGAENALARTHAIVANEYLKAQQDQIRALEKQYKDNPAALSAALQRFMPATGITGSSPYDVTGPLQIFPRMSLQPGYVPPADSDPINNPKFKEIVPQDGGGGGSNQRKPGDDPAKDAIDGLSYLESESQPTGQVPAIQTGSSPALVSSDYSYPNQQYPQYANFLNYG